MGNAHKFVSVAGHCSTVVFCEKCGLVVYHCDNDSFSHKDIVPQCSFASSQVSDDAGFANSSARQPQNSFPKPPEK